MSFEDLVAADAASAFVGDFGESIQYRPSATAAAIAIRGQVFRNIQVQPVPGALSKAASTPVTDVFLPRDPAGVKGPSSKPDSGAQISVAQHQGGTAEWRMIAHVMTEDPGGWLVRCR